MQTDKHRTHKWQAAGYMHVPGCIPARAQMSPIVPETLPQLQTIGFKLLFATKKSFAQKKSTRMGPVAAARPQQSDG